MPAPLVLRTSSGRRRRDRFARIVLIAAALTTFAVTVLIIATLAFDAWDFVRQITEAKRGLGWQLVLVLAVAGVAATLSRRLARVQRSPLLRRLTWPVVFFVVGSVGFTIVGAW